MAVQQDVIVWSPSIIIILINGILTAGYVSFQQSNWFNGQGIKNHGSIYDCRL